MKVENKSINEVLSLNSSSFFIPPFQRAYAWGTQELERYFSDLEKIIISNKDSEIHDKLEHFFGVLVLRTESEGMASRIIVVDGQQRLTTTLLLLIAVRDAENDQAKKKIIEDTFLKNSSATFDEKIKLKQVTKDWDAYKALIQSTPTISSRLTSAYNYFTFELSKRDYSTDDYINAISKMNVALIFLDERPYKGEDPQIIFETLNSLGKPLTLADLIRNFVLLGMPSEEQTNIFENTWHPEIEMQLQDSVSDFFRDYLQYKNSKSYKVVSDSNTKILYAQFTEYVKSEFSDKHDFITDIKKYVPLYKWIVDDDPYAVISDDKSNNKIILNLLRNMFHDIKAEAFKPLVLGLLEYHQVGFNNKKLLDEQLIKALTVIRTYLIRRRILRLTKAENKNLPRLCESIKNEHMIDDAENEMLKMLSNGIYSSRFPNDDEVSAELERIDFYNGLKKYSKFILGAIEEVNSKVSVDFRKPEITIEHIMPQTIDSQDIWKRELGAGWEEIHKKYLHNIGNLILTEFNSEMGNKSLAKKKKQLDNSNLKYRKDVINNERWNEKSMLSHQKKMIKRFLSAFPLPEEMKHAENWNTKPMPIQSEQLIFDDDIIEEVTGTKPVSIQIINDVHEVNYWIDVYLVFMRWMKEEYPNEFMENLDEIDVTLPLIASLNFMNSIPDSTYHFKRMSDGKSFGQIEEFEENDIFVYSTISASTIAFYIRDHMEELGIPANSVIVEIKGENGDF